jgi:hypothetical protein
MFKISGVSIRFVHYFASWTSWLLRILHKCNCFINATLISRLGISNFVSYTRRRRRFFGAIVR